MESMEKMQSTINEIVKSVQYLIQQALLGVTQCYNAIVVAVNANGTYDVKVNGKVHTLPVYGTYVPTVNEIVKIIVPQGNMSVAFILPK